MTPSGIIAIWSGAVIDIPNGWLICDGTHGTPDLRDRFIVGAGIFFTINDTGGTIEHTHDFISDPHNHTFESGDDLGPGTTYNDFTDNRVVTGITDHTDNLPPYYVLAFIMKE